MEPFVFYTGVAAPLDRDDVDTDQIIPKQFLKRIERTGFGQYLFYDWRLSAAGDPIPAFELNQPRYAGAGILLAGRNFGCGSSREHAVWALQDYGIRAVIAPSFADIFRANCLSNGLLPVTLERNVVTDLVGRSRNVEGYKLTVDLERTQVSDGFGWSSKFEIEPFYRTRLLAGLDDIGLTLQYEPAITAFEERQASLPV